MKKLLLAGASYGDIPIIKEAKKLGYYVITSGNRADDLGHNFSDEFHLCDYSDEESMFQLARWLAIHAIVPSCHDLSMVTCAYIAEKLGLPGYDPYETTLNLHHKDRFRQIAAKIGLQIPKTIAFNNIEVVKNNHNEIIYPCIVKPIDLGGGKGISVVNEPGELVTAAEHAFRLSKAKKIVIQEYFNGCLHSFSSFIRNQKVVFYFADNEYSSVNPFGVSTSTSPANDFDKVRETLIQQTELIAKALNLSDGLLHMQYLQKDSCITIVEFTRRMPGDWYSLPVKLSTGVNHAYWTLLGFLGIDIKDLKHQEQNGFYSRHCLMAKKNGLIRGLYLDNQITENIIEDFIWLKNGDVVNEYIYQKFGLFFLKYESKEEMDKKTKQINDLIKIEVM